MKLEGVINLAKRLCYHHSLRSFHEL